MGDRAVGERAWGWWSATADLFLGAGCPGCGSPWWGACPACRAHLRAQPTRLTAPTPAPAGFPLTATAGPYDDVHRGLLGAHKEDQALMLTSLLGDRLAASVGELLTVREVPVDEPVILVPVPSAAAAVRERGFDATGALARRAVRRLSAESTGAHRRAAGAAPWAGRPVRSGRGRAGREPARWSAPAARLGGRLGVRPDGPALVVVDDLVTTGASLTEAARCLAEAGFEVLGAATVSATVRRLSSY